MTQTVTPEQLLVHADWVRRLARTLVLDPHHADDVVQEAWLAALRSPPREGDRARNWLGIVTRNAARRLHRTEARHARREQSAATAEATVSAAELVDRAQMQRDVVDQVLQLEEPYRKAVLHRFFDDLPPRKIAKLLGIPVETVRTRIQRALAKLRVQLDQKYGDRQSWVLAMSPLASQAGAGGLALSLSVGVKAAACAVIVLATGWLTYRAWLQPPRGPESPVPALTTGQAPGKTTDQPEHGIDSGQVQRTALAPPRDGSAGATQPSPSDPANSGGPLELAGVVLDPQRNPVAGATVAWSNGQEDLAVLGAGEQAGVQTTDERGRFTIGMEDRSLCLRHPDFVDLTLRPQGPEAAAADAGPAGGALCRLLPVASWAEWDGVVVLVPKSRISGVLHDGAGYPIADHPIRLDYNLAARGTQTDERGQFAFERVAPGAHVVYVCRDSCREADELALMSRAIEVLPGEDLEIELEHDVAMIIHVRGTLLDAAGPFVAGDHDQHDPGLLFIKPHSSERPRATEASRRTGEYQVELAEPDRYVGLIMLRPAGARKAGKLHMLTCDVPRQDPLTLDLTLPTGKLTGIVLDASSSSPIPGTTVRINPVVDGVQEALRDLPASLFERPVASSGRFAATGFADGDYEVHVSAPGFVPATEQARVIDGNCPDLWVTLQKTASDDG